MVLKTYQTLKFTNILKEKGHACKNWLGWLKKKKYFDSAYF